VARGQAMVWGLIVLGLIIVFAIGLWLYVSDKPIESNNSTNVSQNISYFTFYIESNNLDVVNYQLSNSSNILMSGQLFSGVVEEYTPMVANSTIVNLSIWSDQYYFNVSECNISVNASHCIVNVSRKALDYTMTFNESSLTFNNINGSIIQFPLICFFWQFNVLNVVVPYPRVPIPYDLSNNVSICYQMPNVLNDTLIPIEVHYRPTSSDSGNLFVYIKDTEISSLKNIGTKYSGIIVQKS